MLLGNVGGAVVGRFDDDGVSSLHGGESDIVIAATSRSECA